MKTYTTLTRVVPATLVRRDRMLPTRGKILVSIDDRVDAVDIIGRYERFGSLVTLDARTQLNLKRGDLASFLRKRPGEMVNQGDVIASQQRLGNLFPRVLKAPANGRIVAMTDTQIVLESGTTEAEVRAHLKGRVVSVMPERGAVIETTAALIQCIWGTGEMSHGVVRAAVDSPDDVLSEDRVDVSCLGAIVLGGAGVTDEALEQIGKMQARGLILGGLDSTLIEHAAALPFPVLVTEGFGRYPMNQRAFDLLMQHAGNEASVDPGDPNPWRPRRPEILIPLQVASAVSAEAMLDTTVRQGVVVRVVRGENGGATGTVIGTPERPIQYETGVSQPSVEVQLDSGDRIMVPANSVEVLG